MFRYLPGLLLVQLVTLTLVWAAGGAALEDILVRAGLPALIVTLATALWFSQIGRVDAERTLGQTRLKHAEEREQLRREALVEAERLKLDAHTTTQRVRLDAERDKARVLDEARMELRREERRVERRANAKVALAFAAATGAGVLMLMTQFLTLGIVTITTAGGAMGGYLLHWRQTRRRIGSLPLVVGAGSASSGTAAKQADAEDAIVADVQTIGRVISRSAGRPAGSGTGSAGGRLAGR